MSSGGRKKGGKGDAATIGGGGGGSGNKTVKPEPKIEPPKPADSAGNRKNLQPTAEQIRIAQIIETRTDDPHIKDKVTQVIELTNKSEEEACAALHDCDGDTDRAINMLLEGEGQGGWETSRRRRKNRQPNPSGGKGDPATTAPPVTNHKDKNATENWDDDTAGSVSIPQPESHGSTRENHRGERPSDHGRGRGGGPPRLRGRGGGQGGWRGRENKENEKNLEDSAPGGEPYRGRRGGRSMANGPGRGGGRGGGRSRMGPRTYQSRDNNTREKRQDFYTSGGSRDSGPGGFHNSIDIWNNPSSETTASTDHTSLKVEDWDNEEYTGSLADTKVFTPSTELSSSNAPVQSTVTGSNAGQTDPLQVNKDSTNQSSLLLSSSVLTDPMTDTRPSESSLSSSLPQSIDLTALLQKGAAQPPQGSSVLSGLQSTYSLAHLQATEAIKAAVGVTGGSSSVPSTSSSFSQHNAFNSANFSTTAVSFPSNSYGVSSASYSSQVAKGGSISTGLTGLSVLATVGNRGKSQRARLPPPSKIPSSAVEMPERDDCLPSLDVQFGGLEFGSETSGIEFTSMESSSFPDTNTSNGVTVTANKSTTSLDSYGGSSTNELPSSSQGSQASLVTNLSQTQKMGSDSVYSNQQNSKPSAGYRGAPSSTSLGSMEKGSSHSVDGAGSLSSFSAPSSYNSNTYSTQKQQFVQQTNYPPSSSSANSYSAGSSSQPITSNSYSSSSNVYNTSLVPQPSAANVVSTSIPSPPSSSQQASVSTGYSNSSSATNYAQASYNAQSYSSLSQTYPPTTVVTGNSGVYQGSNSYASAQNYTATNQQSASSYGSSYQQNSSNQYSGANQYNYSSGVSTTVSTGGSLHGTVSASNASNSMGNKMQSSLKDNQYDSSSSGTPVSSLASGTLAVSTSNLTSGVNSLGLSSVPTSINSNKIGSTSGNKSSMSSIPNLPPGVPTASAAMLGGQYILGQPAAGLPIYMQQAPTPVYSFEELQLMQRIPNISNMPGGYYEVGFQAPTSIAQGGRDGSLGSVAGVYSTVSSDARFGRQDNNTSPIPSTLSQQTATHTHQQPILNATPIPPYAYFYGGGMVPGSFQYGAPVYPIPAATNAHGASSGSQFQKAPTYGSSYGSSYDNPLGQSQADFSKSGVYGSSGVGGGNQSGKGGGIMGTVGGAMLGGASSGSSDLAASVYGKSTLGKMNSYEKQVYHHPGTPPPFNMAGVAQTSAMGAGNYTATAGMFIPTVPQHSPLMHAPLHQDTGVSRSQGGSQQGKTSKQQSYSTPYWGAN